MSPSTHLEPAVVCNVGHCFPQFEGAERLKVWSLVDLVKPLQVASQISSIKGMFRKHLQKKCIQTILLLPIII